MKYLMGIDAGTGSIRAALFDLSGQPVASADAAYVTYFPESGWAEQKTEEWDCALTEAVRTCLSEAAVDPEDILALTCDATTNTVVMLDSADEPVRDPILWMDVRASEEAMFIDSIRDRYPVTACYSPNTRADLGVPKMMWFRKHEPERWEKTAALMEFEDWLNFRLTGEKTLSLSVLAFRWHYDAEHGGFPEDFYAACGLGDLTARMPKRILRVGERVGNISPDAAGRLGLSTRTVVIEGTADCNACMFGAGGVTPGILTMIGGTSTCLLGLSGKTVHAAGVNGTYADCMYPGTSLYEGGQTASGALLNWFRDTLLPAEWKEEAERTSKNVFDLITEKASTAPVGSGGLVMMDYFQGNRTPYSDSSARGMFWGLSLATTAADMARALFEGVAYGAAHCILEMQAAGFGIRKLHACGGMTASDFWMQLHADVTGLPIYVMEDHGVPGCLGDVMIAGVGIGLFEGYEAAAEKLTAVRKIYYPDPEAHEKYRFYLDRYRETWPSMRDIVRKTVRYEAADKK